MISFTRGFVLGLDETMRRAGDFTIAPALLFRSYCARGTEREVGSFAAVIVGLDDALEGDGEALMRRCSPIWTYWWAR